MKTDPSGRGPSEMVDPHRVLVESGLTYAEAETALRPSLLPAESLGLTVALAQVLRGEEPAPGVAIQCVLALARLVDRYDYTTEKGAGEA